MRYLTGTDKAILSIVTLLFISSIAVQCFAQDVNFSISFTPPTAKEDGSILNSNEIEGYKINWGIDEPPSNSFEIGNITTHPLTVDLPPRIEPYTLNVTVQTRTSTLISKPSEMASVVFVVEGNKPNPPTQITIQVECSNEGCTVTVIE